MGKYFLQCSVLVIIIFSYSILVKKPKKHSAFCTFVFLVKDNPEISDQFKGINGLKSCVSCDLILSPNKHIIQSVEVLVA